MWANILKAVKGWNPTLLFYKILISIAFVAVACTVAYREGVSDTEQRRDAEEIAQLEGQIVTERTQVIEKMTEYTTQLRQRLDTIEVNSRQYNQTMAEIAQLKGDLDEAINSRPANAACAPSVQELRAYDELAERTRNATGNGVRSRGVR